MIKKLICWLWGCKVSAKALTGDQYDTYNRLTNEPVKGNLYVWQKLKFCPRCGDDLKGDC